jgi:hypothetical protein
MKGTMITRDKYKNTRLAFALVGLGAAGAGWVAAECNNKIADDKSDWDNSCSSWGFCIREQLVSWKLWCRTHEATHCFDAPEPNPEKEWQVNHWASGCDANGNCAGVGWGGGETYPMNGKLRTDQACY